MMLIHYFAAAVVTDENGTRADFDPVYSPPLVESGIVGNVIPEGAESVVVFASPVGLSDDMAARVVGYWYDTFTALGTKDIEPEPEAAPASRKVAPPVVRAKAEPDAVYLDRVLEVVVSVAEAEVARLGTLDAEPAVTAVPDAE